MKAEDSQIRPAFSCIFKGLSGSGKSIAANGKLFRPCYTFNMEGRFESVIDYYRRLDGHVKDVEYDNFPMGSGYYHLMKKMEELERNCPFRSVSMASLTSYIDFVLEHLKSDAENRSAASGKREGKVIAGQQVNELQDYLAEDASLIFEMVKFMQRLKAEQGVNTFLEAHISHYEIRTIDSSRTMNEILTKGRKAPAKLPGYFNEVYLFEKEVTGFGKETKYKVNTVGTAMDDCKSSIGMPSFEWQGQDFSEIFMSHVSGEVLSTPRVDPNAPKKVSFG